MTNPLSPLVYGKVVGKLLAGIIDSPDVGEVPDFPPLEGRVTFTAEVPKYLVPLADPPATVVPLSHDLYTCVLDDEGFLTWRGKRGVYLAAPVAGSMNPTGWTWTVSFDLTYLGTRVPMAPFSIDVPAYTPGPDEEDPDTGSIGLVDLTLVSPVPSSAGNAVVHGTSVESVELDGNDLVFGLDDGTFLPGVTVPSIEDATNAASAAAASAAAAAVSAVAAEDAVDSFDLDIGTVTTGAAGSSASAAVSGGPPAWTLNLTIPRGDTGATGPSAPDATTSVKGIVQLAGDLAGTAASPTVPGKVSTSRAVNTTSPLSGGGPLTSDLTLVVGDASTGAKGVVQLAGVLAGSATSPAFNAAAFGTSSSTACVGNDARLSDSRTPTAAGQAYDIAFVAQTGTRATGAGTTCPMGIKLARAVRFTQVIYRGNTADASGNLVVELRKNGSAVSGTSKTIAAADQTAGGANATNTGTWDFAAADVLTVHVTGVGTTPGSALIADIKGVTL